MSRITVPVKSLVFAALLATTVQCQPVITGAYKLGQIPPTLSVYRDQKIDLNVIPPAGGYTLSIAFSVTPKGPTTFVAGSGQFSYQPAPEDQAEFAATFTATSPTAVPATQTIFIKPLPFLRPDRDFMANRRSPPDETSGNYLKYAETYSLITKKRSVELSGRTVVIDKGVKEFGLINYVPPTAGAPANGDVVDLKIYAETLVVRTQLLVPGATVTIWAREVRFEDPPNTPINNVARIDVTPLAWDPKDIPGTSKDGNAGANSGDVILNIQKFTSLPDLSAVPGVKRLILRGGTGQAAGPGQDGTAGSDLTRYIAPNPFPGGTVVIPPHPCPSGTCEATCPYNAANTFNTIYIDLNCFGTLRVLWGINQWPTDGGNATPSGRPGVGGNGGSVRVITDTGPSLNVVGYVANSGGSDGNYAAIAYGGAAGLPTFSQRQHYGLPPPPGEVHYTSPGLNAYPRSPSTVAANGTYSESQPANYRWLHPFTSRAILDYMKDAYRDGNLELAQGIAADYLPILQQLASTVNPSQPDWNLDFSQDRLEVVQMLARLDANLDYYGNRAGWVPLLSLQANMTLLSQEVTSAVPMLYLAFWMENYAQNAQMNIDAINASKTALWSDVQAARKQYADAVNTLPSLQTRATEIQNEITLTQAGIVQLEQRLLDRAQQNVFERNKVPFWKSACRILASVCGVVPVFQPALMAIGKGLDFVTRIDPDKPLDSYNQGLEIAKQFNSQLFADSSAQLKAELAKLDPAGQSASDYAKSVLGVYEKFSGALDKLRQDLQTSAAPENEVQAELEKLRASDPFFEELSSQITTLNAKKAAFAKSINDTTELMTKSSQTVSANLLTLAELDRTLQKTVKTMDLKTVIQVREMGRRAQDRLQKYLYYMAKSYEYSLVLPYPGDLRLEAVQSRILEMLKQPFTMDPAKFELILEPYRQAIRKVIQDGVDKMQVKSRPQTLPILFSLNSDELLKLNRDGQLLIDLSEKVVGLGNEEEKRILDLRIDDGGITVNPATSTTQLFLGLRITGDSVLTTTYTLDSTRRYAYAFRFGTQDNPDPFSWTDSFVPSLNRLSHSQDSPANLSLLKTFLSGAGGAPLPFNDSDLSAFFFARPSAESQLLIQRSQGGGQITALRFNVNMSYVSSGNSYGVVTVKAPNIGVPTIKVSTTDATSRSQGQGSFRRVFPAGTAVTFTADLTNGALGFQQWVDAEGFPLGSSPSLSITANNSRVVRPVYTTLNSNPGTYTISGAVTDSRNLCATGVTLQLTGLRTASTTSAGDGTYAFANLSAGNYVVTPTKSGCVFAPPSMTFNALAANQIANFAVPSTTTNYQISGQVALSGSPLQGVTVSLTGSQTASVSTDASGFYSLPSLAAGGNYVVTPSKANYTFVPPSATFSNLAANQAANFVATTTTNQPALLSVDRTRLNFAARDASRLTQPQKVVVSFGGGSANWTVGASQPWVQVTPVSGTGPLRLTVSINPALMPASGTATATLNISAPTATPAAVPVNVVLTRLTTSGAPFGAFDTPINNATNIAGSIAVTGWAMDDINVSEVKIYRDKIGNEPVQPNGLVYIGDAIFIANARTDIEALNPNLPFSYQGGWGYLMLTNDVFNGAGVRGNGTIKLWAIAKDTEGNTVTLGSKTITLNNANSKVPFGAMDQPGQGAIVAGTFANSGWVMTPQPNIMTANPSNITLYIDGAPVGKLNYGQARPDVAGIFPSYRNSPGPGASFTLNTALYSNAMHSIYWVAIDDVGNADGIGSRFFFIENGLSASIANPPILSEDGEATTTARVARPRPQRGAVPQVRTAQELERVVIDLPEGEWTGAHVVEGEMRPLPAGSTLDNARGAFYWHLAPGFLGKYELLFTSADGAVFGVTVSVEPRSYERQ